MAEEASNHDSISSYPTMVALKEVREVPQNQPTWVSVALATMEWLLYLIIFCLPLDVYLALPGQSTGIFLSEIVVFETVLILGALVLWALVRKRALPVSLRWRDVVPLGLIVLIGLIATIGAGHRIDGLRECAKYIFYLATYLLARALSQRPNIRRRALLCVLLGFGCVTIIGLVEGLPGFPDIAGLLLNIQRVPSYLPNSANLRAASTFRFSDELESYLLLILPMCVLCALRFRLWEERLFCWTLSLLGFWLLILTYARTAYLIIPVVGTLMVSLLSERRYGRLALWVGGVVAFFAVAVLFFGEIGSRFLSAFSFADSGFTNRYAVWNWALDGITHHPLFGLGPRNLQYWPGAPLADAFQQRVENNAENTYLNTLADIGVIGFAAFTACVVGGLRSILRALHRSGTSIDAIWNLGVFGGFVALLFDGLVHPTFSSGQVTALLCVLVGLIGSIPIHASLGGNDAIDARPVDQLETMLTPIIKRR